MDLSRYSSPHKGDGPAFSSLCGRPEWLLLQAAEAYNRACLAGDYREAEQIRDAYKRKPIKL